MFAPEPDTAIAGRPIVNLSFALNYAIGGIGVRGYHVGNIAIHIACALLTIAFVWAKEWRRQTFDPATK